MNVTDIPQTPENIIIWVGIIFAIGFVLLLIWSIYKFFGG